MLPKSASKSYSPEETRQPAHGSRRGFVWLEQQATDSHLVTVNIGHIAKVQSQSDCIYLDLPLNSPTRRSRFTSRLFDSSPAILSVPRTRPSPVPFSTDGRNRNKSHADHQKCRELVRARDPQKCERGALRSFISLFFCCVRRMPASEGSSRIENPRRPK
ncbi:unnamed protein product [Nippostrongylus brasiliensis]|uniref:Uncharacterized protein n=1 Tax=Nippostrongylus brasiliensis TaxID=27835 RepID=A0A0N4YF25_NIPBR|nr:unnamed protein product [Nippostrongylus brasiliensis]